MAVSAAKGESASTRAPNAPLDLAAVKSRQQATWASGDFSVVASRIVYQAELLCESLDPQAGWCVLDVATGSGNAALAAARRGCTAVGVDYVPSLLERGRIRAQAEHLEVEFVEGDAEKLPFPNRSFDAVMSIYGVMFAPDHQKAASELARVCRPGGRIGLASWTPDGFVGELFRLVAKHLPPPTGLTPPALWGTESHLKQIFGDAIGSMASHVRTAVMRYTSAADYVAFFRRYFGPTLKAFEALTPQQRTALEAEMIDLIHRFERNGRSGGPVAIAADYLESVIVRA